MQLCKFFMEYLRVTQNAGSSYSHKGSLAMDFGGKDTGEDNLYAPCDMIVKRLRYNANGEAYFESIAPVLFADGTSDYLRLLCVHSSEFLVNEGQILSQGQLFYTEGGMGSGNPSAFNSHVHIEAGKGKWEQILQFKNEYQTYVIENQYPLEKLFILGDDVIILNSGGYDWIRESEVILDFEEDDEPQTPEPEEEQDEDSQDEDSQDEDSQDEDSQDEDNLPLLEVIIKLLLVIVRSIFELFKAILSSIFGLFKAMFSSIFNFFKAIFKN